MRAQSFFISALVYLAALGVSACQKEAPAPTDAPSKKEATDENAAKVAAIDPNLAQAVEAANRAPDGARGAPGTTDGAAGGPPPDGVFAPGAADKEIARGASPKLTLGSEGSEPRVQLGARKTPPKLDGTLQLAVQSDPRQGAIPVLLSIQVEPKAAEGGKGDAPASIPVSVRVTAAKIDAPGVPSDLQAAIGRLKGAKIEYSVMPGGAGAGFRVDVPKGAPEEFKDVVRSLSDSFALLSVPFPDKPLGAGGYFMVTSRDELMGLDLVTYRLIKVTAVTADSASLEVNTKRYAASRAFDLPGLPPDAPRTLADFTATSEGKVELPVGSLLPSTGQVTSRLGASLGDPSVQQRPSLQIQTRMQLDLAPAK